MSTSVNILGTEYKIIRPKENEDELLGSRDGYCDTSVKELVIQDFKAEEGSKKDLKFYSNQVIRHEMIHAFLHESGLDVESWGDNEELVDWLSIQLPKMVKAMQEVGSL